jgi:ABC-2 type transport system ATP-binding protein
LEYAVVIKNLYKKFGKKEVFRGLNLKIPKGCFFCILGENGSGKTTLLNIISGSTDYNGQVEIPEGLVIGTSYQVPCIYQILTVKQNIDFFKKIYNSGDEEWIEHIIEALKLNPYLKQEAGILSYGTLKRLDIACSLLHKPDIILLDEPFESLDDYSKNQVIELLRELQDMGKTIILATHIKEPVKDMCNIVGIIKNYGIEIEGSPKYLSHE